MASNKGFTLEVKTNNNQYNILHPKIVPEQVLGWDLGSAFGPFVVTLEASKWEYDGNRAKYMLKNTAVTKDDIIICVPVYEGTKEQMVRQRANYNLLLDIDPYQMESENGFIEFYATEKPIVNIKVQLWWTK